MQQELRSSLPFVGGDDLDHVLHCQMLSLLTVLTELLERLAARIFWPCVRLFLLWIIGVDHR